ncbi:MAG: hypothetical protein J1F28_00965 [Oscillospiraceae bacterium]|nr:hypothetical protein [Oscillospiraceae bacterium]
MEFLGAFAVIFLLVFAAAMLAYLLWNALRSGCTEKVDVYVKPCENLESFIIHASRDAFIGEIYIICGDGCEQAKRLSEKYANVKLTGKSRKME